MAGVVKELDKYGIELSGCVGTCYDTTASNSGGEKGAHFRIEKKVGHAIPRVRKSLITSISRIFGLLWILTPAT